MLDEKKLELYLHIPFCIQKCYYCDFLSMPAEESIRRHYVDMLIKEIKMQAKNCKEYQVSSIFLGGGTPSILEGTQILELMETLMQNFNIEKEAEITIECNPGTLTEQKLSIYKNSGINRLSIGLQSVNNMELKQLGRIHTFEQFLQNYKLARKIGFENINIDLIFSLPKQTLADWEYTLKKVIMLNPEHISAYSLIVEEGTKFYEKYEEDEHRREQGLQPQYLPEEEIERNMYELTCQMLEEKGYIQYEISNYAKPKKECKHNIGYWQLVSYLGLGLGSASFLEQIRFTNTTDLNAYLQGKFINIKDILYYFNSSLYTNLPRKKCTISDTCVLLSKKEQMEEFMFLGLRMIKGVSKQVFQEKFGIEMEKIYGKVLQKLKCQGLLEEAAGKIYLTKNGISVSNYVLSEFLL